MATHNVTTTRDPFVDVFKGIMILWVIHIHTVYWSGYHYISEGVRQATLLADVPIFFFISGYLTRQDSFTRLFFKTARQFVRLYVHYIIISCLLLVLLVLASITALGAENIDIGLALSSMLRMIPHGDLWELIPVYPGSLWFIRDFLSMLVFVPLLLGLSLMFRIRYNLLVFILLFTALFPKEYADQSFMFSTYGNISFYLFFFMAGVIFREQEDYLDLSAVVLSLSVTAVLGLVVFYKGGAVLHIQNYKFPPSTQYLIYSLLLVHVFVLLKKKLQPRLYTYQGKVPRFLRWCGVNIFSIYLFQGAVCSLPFFFINQLMDTLHPVSLYCLLLIFNIALTLLATYLYKSVLDYIAAHRLRSKAVKADSS